MRSVHWAAACGGFLLLGTLVLALAVAWLKASGPVVPLKRRRRRKQPSRNCRLKSKRLQELVPDQAAIMTHAGYHWTNLWFALDKQNWPLAEFYLSETRNNVKWAVRNRPFRKTAVGVIDLGSIAQPLDTTQFTQLKDAIGKKDKDRGIKLYDEAMQGASPATKHPKSPTWFRGARDSPEVNVINFAADAKAP